MRFCSQILLSVFLFITWSSYAQSPTIDGQVNTPFVTYEQKITSIEFSDLIVSDDEPYPTGFTITVLSGGTDYTFSSNTFTPATDFNGTLTVNVQVTDPSSNLSNIFPLQVQVDPVNDPPSFVKGANLSVSEDAAPQSISGWATFISAGPTDESGQLLTFSVSNNDNPSLFSTPPSISSAGTLTYTPMINANGVATVTIFLSDNGGTSNGGDDTSDTQEFTITITAVNDQPSFVKGGNQSIVEDGGAQTVNGWATSINAGAPNESGQVLTFSLSNDNTSLFSVQPAINSAGTLTYTPAANVNGVANVNIILSDNGGGDNTFATQTISMTVTPVNDEPTFIKGADQSISEGAPAQTIANWATAINAGPANENTQNVTFSLTNTNNALFSVQPAISATGTLTYTPAANISGTATVSVTLSDDGGIVNGGDNSSVQTFTITINSINNVPSFTKGANQTILEDGGGQIATNWATAISAGAIDENTQVLTFSVSNDNTSLFSVQPSVNSITGTLTYTPAANANGVANVNIFLSDNGGTANGGVDTSPTQTFTITVNSVNDAPTFVKGIDPAVNEGASAQTSTNWATSITAGPIDENAQALTFSLTNTNNALFSVQPAISSTGTLTFTPALSISGTATVTVVLSDAGGTANGGINNSSQTFTITIASINSEPSFVKGANQTIPEDAGAQSVTGWATAISKGPADESAQVLTFALNNDNTTLFSVQPSISATGTLTYTPAANANGIANVNVTLTDNGGTANGGDDSFGPLSFTISVTAVNDRPVANNDATTTSEDTQVSINVVSNDTDIDGTVNAATVDLNTGLAGIQTTNSSAGGSFSVDGLGNVTFTPNLNFTGLTTLTYTVDDNGPLTSLNATISITVNSQNDNPVAVNDATSTNEETAVSINVLTNDTDPDGNGTINATTVDLNPATPGIQSSITLASVGTFTVNSSGLVLFTPVANFNGLATTTYTVNDNNGASSNVATISITVNAVNDPPVALDDATNTNEDAVVTLNVVSNDTDSDGTINPASVDLNTSTAGIQNSITIAAGTFTVNLSGVVTYTPTLNFNGIATLTYKVNDNDGATCVAAATLTITVNALNDLPVANNDAVTTNEDTPVTINVVSNDTDAEGPINISTVDLNTTTSGIQTTASISGGTISVNASGVVSYTPTINFYGTASASYFVNDNSGATSAVAGTITFTVNAVNDVPFASNDITNADEDEVVTINVVANDIDIDGAIDPNTVDLNTTTAGVQNTITITAGTFSVNPAGVVTYTPTLNFNGNASITYTVKDDQGGISGVAIISISINSINSDPVAANDAGTTNEDVPAVLNVVSNDSDPDGTINAATVDLNPASPGIQNNNTIASGTFVVNPSGQLTFTPILNFSGSASTTYTVNDNVGATSNVATVTITVTSINDAPVANNDTGSGSEGVAIMVNVVTNDTDVDGTIDPATVDLNIIATGIQNTNSTAAGAWSVNPSGVVTFTSINNFSGAATLTYRINDNVGTTSGNGTITITVNGINDPPVAVNDATTTNEDVVVTLNLVANDTDEEGGLSASTVDLNTATAGIQNTITTASGVFSVSSSGILTFTPALNVNGPATITYTINDTGGLTSNAATITITVTPVNDVPVAVNDAATTNEDNAVIFRVTDNDTDVEGPVDVSTIDLNTTVAGIQNTNTTVAGSFSVNATGDVIFTPLANFFGSATLTYKVNDNTSVTSNAATITVTVNAVNDPPSFDPITDVIILENSPLQTVTITGINSGVLESQLLLLTATSGNVALIQPTVTYNGSASTATITFKPTASMTGFAEITVKVVDPGLSEFTRTFRVDVTEINDAPTLNPITFGPILEDAALQNVALGGITAGPGESQTLTVSATSNNAALFETLDVVYASPSTTGTLRIKPKTNAFGTAQITVRVQDSGPNSPAPSVNFFIRTFNLTIQSVNDLPVFVSSPVATANIGEVYTYNIKVTDVEGEALTLTAPAKPTWATLSIVAPADTAACHCNYKLMGAPPIGSGGSIAVKIQVKDPGGVLVDQAYTLVVNTRPTVGPVAITTNEDTDANIAISKLATGFADVDGNPVAEIQITTLPKHGALKVSGGGPVTAGAKILVASLPNGLVYTPLLNYNGMDTIHWNASDGISYSLNASYINLVVNSVNDKPEILPMETDSLLYESGNEPMQLTKIFTTQDVDDDSLVSAEVRFIPGTFSPPDDILFFANTLNLSGNFNEETGVLSIVGKAPLSEYDTAIRAIQYRNLKTVDPEEGLRTVSITINDGKSFSDAETRLVYLYFIEVALDIPDGFTPAGDSGPNDKWEIFYQNELAKYNPELKDAILKVHNRHGVLLFETSGFEEEWDGKVNGEFVPADTYFYTIDLKSSSEQTFKGTVTVLR